MALSGSISTNKYTTQNHGSIGLILSWTASQSIDNNQTTINWTLKSYGTMSSGYSVQAGPVTVKIGGKTVLSATSRFSMYGGGGYTRSGTLKVTHNQDGTKSVAMSVRAALYSASVNCTASKTFTLNKIDRYALLTDAPSFDDQNDPTITYTNTLGAPTVTDIKVRLEWNSGADYTSWVNLSDDGGTQALDLSAYKTAMLQACANSNTLDVVYRLRSTMNGTDYDDTQAATMSVFPAPPTAGTVSYADVNPTSSGITGDDSIIVQSQSTLRISTTAPTPQKEAVIDSIELEFNGVYYVITNDLYADIVKPNFSGTFTATVRYFDSRGSASSSSISIVITPWEQPSAKITLERVNGFETNTELTVDGTISTVTGSSMSIEEKHSDDGGQTWSLPSSVPDNTLVTLSLNNQKDWTVLVSVWDSFTVGSPTEYTLTVSKGIPLVFFDTVLNSVGIDTFPDDNNQLKIDGTILADGVKFPIVKDSAEHKVGYWIDGTTPIYERTIELNSTVTAAAGNSSAAGAWTVLQTGWTEPIVPVEFWAWSAGNNPTLWSHLSIQWERANTRLRVLNVRSTAADIDGFTIRYIKTS